MQGLTAFSMRGRCILLEAENAWLMVCETEALTRGLSMAFQDTWSYRTRAFLDKQVASRVRNTAHNTAADTFIGDRGRSRHECWMPITSGSGDEGGGDD